MVAETYNIIVTGASGQTGKSVLSAIHQLGIPEYVSKVYMGIPSSQEASHFEQSDPKYSILKFDFQDAESIKKAFKCNEGATNCTVMLIPPTSGDKVAASSNVLSVMKEYGIKNLLLLSMVQPLDKEQKCLQTDQFRDIENLLDGEFKEYFNVIVLQSNAYVQNLFSCKNSILKEGELPIPLGEGKYAPVDIHDVGKIAAKLLCDPKEFKTYCGSRIILTGPESLDGQQITQCFKECLQKADLLAKEEGKGEPRLVYDDISAKSDEELLTTLTQFGVPKDETKGWLDYFRLAAQNQFNMISNDYEQVMGIKPMSFKESVQSYCVPAWGDHRAHTVLVGEEIGEEVPEVKTVGEEASSQELKESQESQSHQSQSQQSQGASSSQQPKQPQSSSQQQ